MEIYMIGIKGAGMSALAIILLDDQYLVRGSDKKDYIHSQDELIKRKVIIDSLQQEEYLNSDIIIIGHSFYTDELVQKLNLNKKVYFEYHEFLSLYLDQSKTISICGSHGKTTLTKLLAKGSLNASYLIGDGEGSKKESDDFFFLESCEYKNHFLLYNPKEIIITNIDYDHVDFFKDEKYRGGCGILR
jgi:UDP-N-acetylmuramate--alanine ligase